MDVDWDTWSAIQEAVRKLVGSGSGVNALAVPTLDVTRPNTHDSKSDFLQELEAVEVALDGVTRAMNALLPKDRDTNEKSAAMVRRLERALDAHARERIPKDPPNTVTDLLRKNRDDTGLYHNSLWNLIDLLDALRDRLIELKDQEREFWSVKNRPPNYYARAVALRLARLYAQEKGAMPTFGTARDGGHPSTDFGRTLEEVFALLGINGSVKRPAKYAIGQLTEDDLRPKSAGLLGDLLGAGAYPGPPRNSIAAITEELEKGSRR